MHGPLAIANKLKKTDRAGVIPYVVVHGNVHFLLGKDWKTRELTDFGGGVKLRESCIAGALREFKEETNQIFDPDIYQLKGVQHLVALSNFRDMTIIFVRISTEWFTRAIKEFKEKKKTAQGAHFKEIHSLVWIHETEFRKIIFYNNENIMWKRIQKFLAKHANEEFFEALKSF